ncbi:MAG: tRNA 2-thiouridine(34) synthase MnmA [Desulfatibacillaceae bacterium]
MPPVIAIAMSGGVDSLVAAAMLKEAGHQVFGLHFTTGHEPVGADEEALSGAAEAIGVPLHRLDLSDRFEAMVVRLFTEAYLSGRTPNPCMACNPAIKFGDLLSHARQLGAERLATGHYARVMPGGDGGVRLLKGSDPTRDQSYFLAFLDQARLTAALFPLGERTKDEVRKQARERGLDRFTRPESRETCFMADGRLADFLRDHAGVTPRPGPIVDTRGKQVGEHAGVHAFTIGQRRGLNCPSTEPWYVVRILPGENTLVVGRENDLYSRSAELVGVQWIRGDLRGRMETRVRIRYRHQEARATVEPLPDHRAGVVFDNPQKAVTPGQGAVFYDGDEVLGAGWIARGIE